MPKTKPQPTNEPELDPTADPNAGAESASDLEDEPPVDVDDWLADHPDDPRYQQLANQCALYRILQDSMAEIVADTKQASKSVKTEIDKLVKALKPPRKLVSRRFEMVQSVSTTKKVDPVRLAEYGVSVQVIKQCTVITKKNVTTIRTPAGSGDPLEGVEEE